jgi:hypothetical protein
MKGKLFSLVLFFYFFTTAGCTTSGIKLATAAHPSGTLIKLPRACAGELITDPAVREYCLKLAELEAQRAREAARASAYAQAAETAAKAEKARILADDPCAGGWVMAPSFCYGGYNGVFDGGASYYRMYPEQSPESRRRRRLEREKEERREKEKDQHDRKP